MNIDCKQNLSKLTFRLIAGRPFFGKALVCLKDAQPSLATETAAASQIQILYNEDFMQALPEEEANFVWLHELYHIILMHAIRIKGRNHLIWNLAADLVVNDQLQGDKNSFAEVSIPISMPQDAIYINDPDYMSSHTTEQIYADLLCQFQAQGGDNKLIGTYIFKLGDSELSAVVPNLDLLPDILNSASEEQLEDLKSYIKANYPAYSSGKSIFKRELSKVFGTKLPWYRYVRRFLTSIQSDEESFDSPNKNYLWKKQILPGKGSLDREVLADIILLIDVSGSIVEETLSEFLYQYMSLINDFELTGRIIFWSVGVDNDYDAIEFMRTNNNGSLKIESKGGTVWNPVKDYIDVKYSNAALAICLTDGHFSTPKGKTKMPLIWCLYHNEGELLKPFGRVITID